MYIYIHIYDSFFKKIYASTWNFAEAHVICLATGVKPHQGHTWLWYRQAMVCKWQMYRTRWFLKTDNAEIPVSFPPNLEISAALGIYQVLKDIGPALQISRKEGSRMDSAAGDANVSRTRREKDSPGIVNQEDGSERKTGFCPCMRQRRTKIEVLTASSIQTQWESLSSFVLWDKSRDLFIQVDSSGALWMIKGVCLRVRPFFRHANQD